MFKDVLNLVAIFGVLAVGVTVFDRITRPMPKPTQAANLSSVGKRVYTGEPTIYLV